MPDLGQILLQAQQMQAEMERAQSSLAEAEVTGTAGGGLVTAVVNGGGDLLRIRIDPSVVDPADVETLEDLVVAAVHDAKRSAEELASNAMGSVASSLDLSSMGLPGLNFPGFGAQQALEQDFEDFEEDDDDDDETGYADAAAVDAEIIEEEAELAEQDEPPAAPGPGRI
jgi:DNA-binding YbaB/EbfC family protein